MSNRETFLLERKLEIETLYYDSFMTQAEIGQHFGVAQNTVSKFMKQHGIKARIAAKRDQRGEKNSAWKGDSVSYKGAHDRVRSVRGNPTKCIKCNTTEGKLEWASISKQYHDPNDYQAMCVPCHRNHDLFLRGQLVTKKCPVCQKEWLIRKSLENQVCCSCKCAGEFKSTKINPEQVISLYKSGYTKKQIGQKYNLGPTSISRILKKYNIQTIYKAPSNKILHTINPEEVKRLYLKGMNQKSIAKIFNVASTSISNFFKIHNIPSRNTGTKEFYNEQE